MDALSCEGIEHSRQNGHQGLALACAHLGNLPLVQDLHTAATQLWPLAASLSRTEDAV